MRGAELPDRLVSRRKHRRSRRSRGSREKNKKAMLAWSVLFSGLSFCAIGFAVFLWLRNAKQQAAHESSKQIERAEPDARVISKFQSPSEQDALQIVKQAMQVRDPASITKYFRLGAQSPESVVSFLGGMEKVDGAIKNYTWMSSVDRNGLLIDGVVVLMGDDSRPKNRIALLTPNDAGAWLIDFEAFARISKPSLHEMVEGEMDRGTLRVFVNTDSYYNSVFIDESQWTCYRLVSPDSDQSLFGYCKKQSAQDRAMTRIIENSGAMSAMAGPVRVTLEIRRIANSEARQFEIDRILAEDWILSATEFDTNFK